MALVAHRSLLAVLVTGTLLTSSCRGPATPAVDVVAALPTAQSLELELTPDPDRGTVAVRATWTFDGRLSTPLTVDFAGRQEAPTGTVAAFDGAGNTLVLAAAPSGLRVLETFGSNRITFVLEVTPTDGLIMPSDGKNVVAMLATAGRSNAWLPRPAGATHVRVDTHIELPGEWVGAAPGAATSAGSWSSGGPLELSRLSFVAGAFERVDDGSQPRLSVWSTPGESSAARAAAVQHTAAFAALERVLGTAPRPVAIVYTLGLVGESVDLDLRMEPGAVVVPVEWLGATELAAADAATAVTSGLAGQWIGTPSEQPIAPSFWRGVAAHTADWIIGDTLAADARARHLDAARSGASIGGSYERGYATANLVQGVVGDGPYVHALRTRSASGSTAEWIEALEKASDQQLSNVVAPWTDGRGVPEFELSWAWQPTKQAVELEVRQRQSPSNGVARIFQGPVDIEVVSGRRIVRHRIDLSERDQTFLLPCESDPTWTRFDASLRLPHVLVTRPDRNGVLARANRAELASDRVDALREVGELAREVAVGPTRQMFVTQLTDAAVRDTSSWVREVAVRELGGLGGLESRATLERTARQDASNDVRAHALGALGRFAPDPALARLADDTFTKFSDPTVRIAAARLFAAADPARASTWLADRLGLASPHGVVRAAVLDLWSQTDAPQIDETLVGWATDPLAADAVRRVALRRLVERARPDRPEPAGLAALLTSDDPRWRRPAIEALGRYQSRNSRGALAAFAREASSRPEAGLAEAALQRR